MDTSAKKVFMNRDGMSAQEATEQVRELREEVTDMIEDGASYDDVEELLMDYGLEMDYIFDFL